MSIATQRMLVDAGGTLIQQRYDPVQDKFIADLVPTCTLIERSGTITLGATAQTLAPSNASRKYFLFQNNSAGNLWINFTLAASTTLPSFVVVSGASFVMENSFVSNEAISVVGATTGQAFTCKEA